MMMRGGKMRHRVTIKRPGGAADTLNQPLPDAWTDVATVWADIRTLNGVETIRAGAQTSTVQASIRMNDPSKFLTFSVSSLASPSGYKNITVANVAYSAASPFSNGDAIVLKFTPNGDQGPAGTSGLTLLATITPTASTAANALSAFSSSYDNILIIGDGITVAADDTLLMRFAVAGSLDTGSNYFRGTSYSNTGVTTTSTSFLITGATLVSAGEGCNFSLVIKNANDATRFKSFSGSCELEDVTTPSFQMREIKGIYKAANAISGVGFLWSGGSNFGATGKIRIFGYNNT